VHVLLYHYFGWEADMPEWAHLPLILKPDGNGKLSKRDGDRLGFPVFSLDWKPKDGELQSGFRERGFLPQALINFLVLLGWNPGVVQEIFTLNELVELFDIQRVHHAGAKFDFDKCKWFNHQYVQLLSNAHLADATEKTLLQKNVVVDRVYLEHVCSLVKERCTFIHDVWENAFFFFQKPESYDLPSVQPKWNADKATFFNDLITHLHSLTEWTHTSIENTFKDLAVAKAIKVGELQMPFRIMLCGGKFGPPVFEIAATIGKVETIERIQAALNAF
jgi:glutamyl-tRNA synthetase